MDQQIMKRKHRIAVARQDNDTTMMWDLIAAAVEQANILFHKLQGKDAKKMRGRSKIFFEKHEDKPTIYPPLWGPIKFFFKSAYNGKTTLF